MSTILYAVIALTTDETEEVSKHLRAKKKKGVADWFDNNKGALYGGRSEDWKPFDGKTISQVLNESDKSFQSQTNLIRGLYDRSRSLTAVLESGIEIYFIDVFALYLDRHRNLAIRLDGALAQSEKCCFVLPYGLPDESEELLSDCKEYWPTVFDYYTDKGALHRFAVRAAELTNVRGYCLKRASGGPNPALSAQASQKLGSDNPTTPPRNIAA